MLPDGRIVNRSHKSLGQMRTGGGPGAAVDLNMYTQEDLIPAQQQMALHDPTSASLPPRYDVFAPDTGQGLNPYLPTQPYDIPTNEMQYGSPREETRFPLSPPQFKTLNEVGLPASFDSKGSSSMWRHGPVAASMPSKVGLQSPPSSFQRKSALNTEALSRPRESVHTEKKSQPNFGSSPLTFDETSAPRTLHSQRSMKQKNISASLPVHDEWEDQDDLFGEQDDYLPSNLLNSEIRTRRLSNEDQATDSRSRTIPTSNGRPSSEFTTKLGSPGQASPSRFMGLFTEQQRHRDGEGNGFGPVGSPLRSSPFSKFGTSPSTMASNSAHAKAFETDGSPSKMGTGISMLSQQLRGTRISSRTSSSENYPTTNTISSSLAAIGTRYSSNPRSSYERVVSSSSVNANKIDEEPPEEVFSLDEDEPAVSGLRTGVNGDAWPSGRPDPGLMSTGSVGGVRGQVDGRSNSASDTNGAGTWAEKAQGL